ncbi:thioredoxin domain-containing protein [Nitratiruptor tergarcus]|uniref:Spermatogenesis-associated protein 20-like TRX domain-containing protein n=1 Tax=Nitratiruptor tergarcus DSM 16512 TaxID=1069081 RepID=A0A1W1WSZ6_9BACT|nr:thioredoxin domain-containing protein [Nitratiruptor tergarcus]SMC09424.1 hypothetical protein SAMN05660197_1232 [Nitratiruptor tergarcus DSM 16512]
MANRLEKEQSPYLQQHKNNPVDWYPWGEEAFKKAKEENKPIFLSIGYSSCHWCHVMEKEVFENEEAAKYLNEHFVSIKVDREERPDIDKYYQEVHQLLNQRPGGWPLSIFMTPDKEPIFAATYIPLEPKYGMPGFIQLLKNIVTALQKDPQEIKKQGRELLSYLKPQNPTKAVKFDEKIADIFVEATKKFFDPQHGGFGHKPKFPHTSTINTLLDIYRLNENKDALHMAEVSLQNMAKGGLRDLVDGGFCRYSVDEKWLVPHFEKMAYDNALLMESYLKAYTTTKNELYKDIAFEIADFISEYMSQKGLFYSASDADSEGEEGKYFVYDYDEVVKKLEIDGFSPEEIQTVLQKLGITKAGNFEGKNIVRVDDLQLCETSKKALKSLKDLRKSRCYPFIDKKIITSWNAMMIKSLYMAARIESRYFEIAEESLQQLLQKMYIDEHLYHAALINKKPTIKAFLEDYAYLATALLEAYKTTLNEEYLARANLLVNDALTEFFDNGRWYFSKGEIWTEAEHTDTSYPSSAAVMVEAMLTLGSLLDEKYIKFSFDTIEFYSEKIYKYATWSAKFIEDVLRFIYQDKIIKADAQNLAACNEIDFAKYPFTLLKSEEIEGYMLCNRSACFLHTNDCQEIIKALNA